MRLFEKLKNYLKLFSVKRNEAIYTCLQNNIPLTDNNVSDVEEIVKQRKEK